MTDNQAHLQGRVVASRYRLVRELSRSGTGTMWLADDQMVGRQVAVKELRPPQGLNAAERDTFTERAFREARSAARLHHPGAVILHDIVPATDDGAIYLIMEYLDGPTLAQLIAQHGPQPAAQVAAWGLQLLAVLETAHGLGIIHRDVEPANIIITGGQAKLSDFGIAHSLADTRLTRSGILGSQAYLAPELFDAHPLTPAADLWSLGATLYAATAGHGPFDRDTTSATLRAVLVDSLPTPPGPPVLATAIASLLQRDPAGRASISQARAHLQQAALPSAAAVPAPQPAAAPAPLPSPPPASAVPAPTSRPPGPDPAAAAATPAPWDQAATTRSPSPPPVPASHPDRQEPQLSRKPVWSTPAIIPVFITVGVLLAGVILSISIHKGGASFYGPVLLFVGFFGTIFSLLFAASKVSRRPNVSLARQHLLAHGERAEYEWTPEWKGLSAVFMGSSKRQALAEGRTPGVLVFGWGITLADWDEQVTIRWEEITELLKGITQRNVRVGMAYTYQMLYSYKLQLASGRSKAFGGMLGERLDRASRATQLAGTPGVTTQVTIEQLGRLLDAGVTRVQFPAALQRLNAGQPLSFGPLTVTRQGIATQDKSLSWSEIQEVKTAQGFVSVKKAGNWLNWTSAPVSKIPNYSVFDALAQAVLRQKPPAPGR
jgi:serine/threonine protein kinase